MNHLNEAHTEWIPTSVDIPRSESWKCAVEAATVRIDGLGGQGVLVGGSLILTSAHCINWNGSADTVPGDVFIERITTKEGRSLRVTLGFADPVSDIAVLRALDDQHYCDDIALFKAWCEETSAVQVADFTLRPGDSLPVAILSHDCGWIPASITRYGIHETPQNGSVALIADQMIKGDTSGGPIVDSMGRLVGIVSNGPANDCSLGFYGNIPIASLALPRWSWGLVNQAEPQPGPPSYLAVDLAPSAPSATTTKWTALASRPRTIARRPPTNQRCGQRNRLNIA